jgi:hypothetical protein
MVLADGSGTPLGVHLENASPSEVKAPTMDGGALLAPVEDLGDTNRDDE